MTERSTGSHGDAKHFTTCGNETQLQVEHNQCVPKVHV